MKITSAVFILTLLSLASCQNKNKYDLFADDLCACMKPMAELQKKMMDMQEAGNEEEMMAFFEQAQKVDEEGQACMQELEKKHGVIEGKEEEEKAMDALRKTCPDIVAMMEESAEPEPEMPSEEGGLMPDTMQ